MIIKPALQNVPDKIEHQKSINLVSLHRRENQLRELQVSSRPRAVRLLMLNHLAAQLMLRGADCRRPQELLYIVEKRVLQWTARISPIIAGRSEAQYGYQLGRLASGLGMECKRLNKHNSSVHGIIKFIVSRDTPFACVLLAEVQLNAMLICFDIFSLRKRQCCKPYPSINKFTYSHYPHLSLFVKI